VAAVSCVNARSAAGMHPYDIKQIKLSKQFFTVRNLYQYIHKTESFILSPWLSPSAAALPWFAVTTAS